MENLLLMPMFELPDQKNVKKLVITKEMVEGTSSPQLISPSSKSKTVKKEARAV